MQLAAPLRDLRGGTSAGGSDRPSRRLGVTGGPPAGEDAAAGWSGRSPVRFTSSGCGIKSSPTPQPSTAQMTSRSDSLMLAGFPDHSPDIFPALMASPWSASIRCSSLAFQMPRLAAARRRFHFIARPRSSRQSLQTGDGTLLTCDPGVLDMGSGENGAVGYQNCRNASVWLPYPQKIAVGSRSISVRRSLMLGDGGSWS